MFAKSIFKTYEQKKDLAPPPPSRPPRVRPWECKSASKLYVHGMYKVHYDEYFEFDRESLLVDKQLLKIHLLTLY